MIIDTIDNLCKYAAINPLFADVVEFLKSHDLNTMEAGKYPIKDKDLFLNLTSAKGKTKEAADLSLALRLSVTHLSVTFLTLSIMQRRTSRSMVTQWLRHM